MSAPPVTSTDITELQDSGLSWCSSRPGTKSKQNVRQSRINGRYCCRAWTSTLIIRCLRCFGNLARCQFSSPGSKFMCIITYAVWNEIYHINLKIMHTLWRNVVISK